MMSYCKAFSKNIHHHFTNDTIRLTALTGSAGVEIGGDTTARVFSLNMKRPMNPGDCEQFADTRLNIVDEIGFGGQKTLEQLSTKLRNFTNCNSQMYGNIAIVFIGDFCQLPTIGQARIFEDEESIHWKQSLNQLVELDGHHHYADDPALGNAMASARNGNPQALRAIMKKRVIKANNLTIPPGVESRFATHTNKKRTSINAQIFQEYLQTFHHTDVNTPIPQGTLIIRGTGSWAKSQLKMGHNAHKKLWENCSDADIRNGHTMANPFLCLFYGCELMVNDNIDVKNGIANGTCCQFEKAFLRPGTTVEKMQVHGRWVNTVDINNVDHIVLRFDVSYHPRYQGRFKLTPRERTFEVNFPIDESLLGKKKGKIPIKLNHFPIVGNFATTVHKLQGKTMANLVITEWTNTDNWAYVVLSRVRTSAGLFLMNSLPDDISFEPNAKMVLMMDYFRNNILATPQFWPYP